MPLPIAVDEYQHTSRLPWSGPPCCLGQTAIEPRIAAQCPNRVYFLAVRVLVVEDEKKTASFIRKALQAEGFAVDACDNGAAALAAPSATPYDVIVLDIMLPGRDGLSVL